MKKVLLGFAAIALLFTGCDSAENEITQEQSKIDMSDFYVYTNADADEASRPAQGKDNLRYCSTMKNLNRLLKENPGLEKKMFDIEYHTRQFIAGKKPSGTPGGGNGNNGNGGIGGSDPQPDNLGTITIPVNFIVVYNNSAQNVSDSQLNAQIDVLNEDFRKLNLDINKAPSEFSGVAADSEIQFTIANVERHSDGTSSWGSNDAIKSKYPPTDTSTQLNIWVCNLGGGLLGYAQFPGGPASTDGIVILYSSLPGGSANNYNGGRTATHEVGHYLNLRHIWGDGRCRQDDFVSDTPSSDRPNYGCPNYPTVHCKSNDMTMNYMDYVYDNCMYMFTEGQKDRMRAIFASGGARESMISSP